MNEDNNLDLLDLEETDAEALPEVPFSTPRPRKPWLLLGVGLLIIVLATYIIVRTINNNSSSEIDINLDEPVAVNVDDSSVEPVIPVPDINSQPTNNGGSVVANVNVVAEPQPPMVVERSADVNVAPVVESTVGVPVQVVPDRKDVVFDPNKVSNVKQDTTNAVKSVSNKAVKKASTTKAKVSAGSWYVQFGSYSTHEAAETAERQIRKSHAGLLSGKQFVILAAVLKDGKKTYRLRIAFNSSNEANGFCRNAKSDGLDCYVAK